MGDAGLRLAALDPRAHHAQDRVVVERPVAVERTGHDADDVDVDRELLAQLAHERASRVLARLDLPARQLPAPGEGGGAGAPGGEQPAAPLDRSGDDDATTGTREVSRLRHGR